MLDGSSRQMLDVLPMPRLYPSYQMIFCNHGQYLWMSLIIRLLNSRRSQDTNVIDFNIASLTLITDFATISLVYSTSQTLAFR